jgi:pimeloyl-ACP methyl ester carboxylesterase
VPKKYVNPSQRTSDQLFELSKKAFTESGLVLGKDFKIYKTSLRSESGYLTTLEAGFAGSANKKKLVLVHGAFGNITNWIKIVPLLIKDYHVFAFDLYGHGSSYHNDYVTEETYRYNYSIGKIF